MKQRIVDREEARLAEELLHHGTAFNLQRNAGAYGASVGSAADKFDLEPVAAAAEIVPQQRRWLVEVDDKGVEIAVVVEVSDGKTAAAVVSRLASELAARR